MVHDVLAIIPIHLLGSGSHPTYTITATCLSDLALVEYSSKATVKDEKKLIVQVGALVILVL